MRVVEELERAIHKTETKKYDRTLNENLMDILENFVQSDIVSLFTYNEKERLLELKLHYSRDQKELKILDDKEIVLSMVHPKGCIGKTFLTKRSAIYNHIVSDKDYAEEYDNLYGYKLKSQMLMPILENDMLKGIISISTVIKGALQRYSQKEAALLKATEPYLLHLIGILTDTEVSAGNQYDARQTLEDMTHVHESQTVVNDDSMLLFFSNTVHDIRTPANSLYGFLELLEDKLEDKRLKGFVTNAKESASFINTLTTSILDTAKNRYASALSENRTICPEKSLSDTANTFSAKMLEKKIHYFIYISPNIPKEIKVDSMKLQRILVNLIGNAYKFTPKKKEIHVNITWNASDSRMAVSVKDTGIGIDESSQKKLFQAFSQATDTTHAKYGGTGLGLAISAGYVSDLGGELKVKSKLDEGSEFYFEIPVEIIDPEPKYTPFSDLEKKIVILTDYTDAKYPEFIRRYLVDFGMPKEKIVISDILEEDATHVICFEEKISEEILTLAKLNTFKLLLVEQSLFSLLHHAEMSSFQMTSKNVYNGDAIYSTVYSGSKLKVLIVDDNKINLSLLEAMLETSYIEVALCEDAKAALKKLKKASKNNQSYDIIYLDKHMPTLSGTELLRDFRAYEKKHNLKPIYAVSISGDPYIPEEEKELFDTFVCKPFKKEEVRDVISIQRSKT